MKKMKQICWKWSKYAENEYAENEANIRKPSSFSASGKKKPKLYEAKTKTTVHLQTRPGISLQTRGFV